ncbi:mycofactocin biosynthesis peptidyl-dipeptidase MftE [Streptomyces sp. YIM S03343]
MPAAPASEAAAPASEAAAPASEAAAPASEAAAPASEAAAPASEAAAPASAAAAPASADPVPASADAVPDPVAALPASMTAAPASEAAAPASADPVPASADAVPDPVAALPASMTAAPALADLPWPELTGRRPLVLLPLGSCEQHGPHLPLDTDTAVATAVAERAAARLGEAGGVLVAPAQPYGASGEHEGFPGTVSIGHEALRLLLVETGRSLLRWASRLLVVNGHGGNLDGLTDAVTTLRREGRDVAWWPCVPPGSDAHAGRTETSMMLTLRPAAVRTERAVAGPTEPVHLLMDRLIAESVGGVSPSGVLGDPAGAHAEEGGRLLDAMADRLTADLGAWRITGNGRLGAPATATAQAPVPAGARR